VPVPEPGPDTTPTAAETAAACELAQQTFDPDDRERAKAWSNGNGLPTKNAPPSKTDVAIDEVAGRIYARHPAARRVGIGEIKKQLRAILSKAKSRERLDLLRVVDTNHAGWCASPDWQKDGGQFCKGLSNWLSPTMERWKEPPPAQNGRPLEDDGYRPASEWDGF
jgi:hypothetical protein